MPITLAALNALDAAAFTKALAQIFEHSSWIPERTAVARPFSETDALHAALCATLAKASATEKLALIRAHPELAGRAAEQHELTADSASEQRGAGLDRCSPAELARLTAANAAYTARFGFPFIIAVKGLGRADILDAIEQRLHNSYEQELATALQQIERIAAFRLADLIRD